MSKGSIRLTLSPRNHKSEEIKQQDTEFDYIARPLKKNIEFRDRVSRDIEFNKQCHAIACAPRSSSDSDERKENVYEMFSKTVGLDHGYGFDTCEWMKYVNVFGIIGSSGSGKDFVAKNFLKSALSDRLNEDNMCLKLAFADTLKREMIAKYGFSYYELYIRKNDVSRQHAQKVGTEYGRNVFGDNVWINSLLAEMRTHYKENDIKDFVIADVRFANELVVLADLFPNYKTIKVNAPDRHRIALERETGGDQQKMDQIDNHISERFVREIHPSWVDMAFDNTIDGGKSLVFREAFARLSVVRVVDTEFDFEFDNEEQQEEEGEICNIL